MSNKQKSKADYESLVKAVSGEYRTLLDIGNEFGLTRERIRQLINKFELRDSPGRQIPDRRKPCRYCGELVDGVRPKHGGKQNLDYHKSCSKEHQESRWLTIPCSNCKTDIRILKSDRRLKVRKMDYLFCSYQCSALYRIEHQTDGWGVWSKNINKIRQEKQ